MLICGDTLNPMHAQLSTIRHACTTTLHAEFLVIPNTQQSTTLKQGGQCMEAANTHTHTMQAYERILASLARS